ncbi:MAG TPA: type II secretion system protein [Tepidisphaeraceae bacterium]|jgi:type II secretory pathway pseudopilin PulG|nr:type II secretion system protein [Tepidisphaeraceae bacterium]
MRIRRGFVFIDVLMGMIIVSILGAILGGAAAMHQRSLKHLDATRAASHLAESALLSMQSGQPPRAAEKKSLAIHELSSADVPGMSWVEVRATVHGRSASLVGLVPRNTIPPSGD